MRILVTGGAGYIGSVVVAQLLEAGHDVIVLDDLSSGHADAVPPAARLHRADIAEVGNILGAEPVDGVMHFAAKSLVGESMHEPARYWHTNVAGTMALLDAMRAHGVSRIVFSSSAATYGEAVDMPIEETAPARPTSPYGASKLAVDLMLADYARAYGMAAVSLRYFNVAGALHTADSASYGERHGVETHLIPVALRAAADGKALSIFGTDYPTADGTCVRDYIHVVDLGEAHLRALERAVAGTGQVVNLGSGTGNSVREVLAAVAAVTGRDLTIREEARRAGDPATLIASNERAASVLGWRPTRALDQMVEDAWRFHLREVPA
jgi:UDP-glucose 4-epimerase